MFINKLKKIYINEFLVVAEENTKKVGSNSNKNYFSSMIKLRFVSIFFVN